MLALIDGYTFFLSRDDGRLAEEDGLYHRDTRLLSSFSVSGERFDLVNVGAHLDSPSHRTLFQAQDRPRLNSIPGQQAALHTGLVVRREQFVDESTGFYEKSTVTNHSATPLEGRLNFDFAVDFADVFEVRGLDTGIDREIDATVDDQSVTYAYDYNDREGTTVSLRSIISMAGPLEDFGDGFAVLPLNLDSQEAVTAYTRVTPDPSLPPLDIETFWERQRAAYTPNEVRTALADRSIGDAGFDRTIAQSLDDLSALVTDEFGAIPLTGVPWFATVFGRDLLITALQLLPFVPDMAQSALQYLADHQGTETNPETRERAGKIFHEMRHGELARTGRIPHTPYYGTIDATLLWIVLLDEVYRWTGDEGFVRDLEGTLTATLDWLTEAVERTGDDPFIYYDASPNDTLEHKAWRDTPLSVQFRDGELADPPIASVEVQGYLYDALTRAAALSRDVFDEPERASGLFDRADRLKTRFNEVFWLPAQQFFGLALTDDGRLVNAHTSNVGQCLWSGIIEDDRTEVVVERLFTTDLFSGWGVRTMSADEAGYSPMSYHVGSVWPHDNALVALGCASAGHNEEAATIARGIFAASTFFEDNRVPELFCGFDASVRPIPYGPACAPQAWAAAAPFGLLRAAFAIGPTAPGQVEIGYRPDGFSPAIPEWLVNSWQSDSRPATFPTRD